MIKTIGKTKFVKPKEFIRELNKFSKNVIISTLLHYSSIGHFDDCFREFLFLLKHEEKEMLLRESKIKTKS